MAKVRKRTWSNAKGEQTAWIADYFDQDGKRHIKTFKRERQAKAWLVEAQHEVTQGVHTPASASITIAEAADLWLERCRLLVEQGKREHSTYQQYASHRDHIVESLIGPVKLAKLTKPTVTLFCDELLDKGMSLPTARKVLTSLKTLIAAAQDRGYVAQNVAATVRFEKSDRRSKPVIPSKEEVRLIIEHAGKWRPLLITAALTGLRSSELRGLRWEDVDLDRTKVLHVRRRADCRRSLGDPKTRAGARTVPLAPPVLNILREHKFASQKPLGFVFANGRGNVDFNNNILVWGFHPVQVRAGVVDNAGKPKFGLHSLRHFFASWIIEQGFTAKKLQALLGHSSIQMTFDRYGHLFPNLEDDHNRFAAGALAIVG
jgi:integrase